MTPLDRLRWLEQVAGDAMLPAPATRAAVLLSRYVNGTNGIAWPSQKTLTRELQISLRGLQLALAALQSAGHLKTKINKGRGATNQYRPILKNVQPSAQQTDENVQPSAQQTGGKMRTRLQGGCAPGCRGGAHQAAGGVRTVVRRELKEGTGLENRLSEQEGVRDRVGMIDLEQTDATDPDPFEAFWNTYPRKASKGSARKAWAAALKKADPEILIAGATAYAGATAMTEPRFIKHPATWLNAEGWLDTPEPRRGFVTIDQDGAIVADAPDRPSRRPAQQIDDFLPDLIAGRYRGPV